MPTESTEGEFKAALRRLLSGQPRNKENQKNPFAINIRSVAREAGRSPTLIGHEGCRYPHIRRLINRVIKRRNHRKRNEVADLQIGSVSPSSVRNPGLVEMNNRLRKQLQKVTAEAAMYATLLAEADQQLRLYEGKDEREAFDEARKARRARKNR